MIAPVQNKCSKFVYLFHKVGAFDSSGDCWKKSDVLQVRVMGLGKGSELYRYENHWTGKAAVSCWNCYTEQ